jgi:hypothetical protein
VSAVGRSGRRHAPTGGGTTRTLGTAWPTSSRIPATRRSGTAQSPAGHSGSDWGSRVRERRYPRCALPGLCMGVSHPLASSPLPIWAISDGFTRSLNPACCKLMRDRMGTDTWHHASGFSASWTAATCHPRPAGTAAGTTASYVGTVASPARCSRVSRTWVQRPVLHRQAVPKLNGHAIRTGDLSAAADPGGRAPSRGPRGSGPRRPQDGQPVPRPVELGRFASVTNPARLPVSPLRE